MFHLSSVSVLSRLSYYTTNQDFKYLHLVSKDKVFLRCVLVKGVSVLLLSDNGSASKFPRHNFYLLFSQGFWLFDNYSSSLRRP